nr:hypothetical protein Iba_scaffold3961.4CG0500 [Ipomoea batatas]
MPVAQWVHRARLPASLPHHSTPTLTHISQTDAVWNTIIFDPGESSSTTEGYPPPQTTRDNFVESLPSMASGQNALKTHLTLLLSFNPTNPLPCRIESSAADISQNSD